MWVTVASIKGSPGATTTAVALAAVWPGETPDPATGSGTPPASPLVVEADCAGGDLGGRCWLPDAPGLAGLATAARSGSVALERYVAHLPCGVDAVIAPAGRHPATVSVGLLVEAAPVAWAGGRSLIVDVGRIDAAVPSTALLEAAGSVLVCTRADETSLLRLAGAGLARWPVEVVVVGPSAYPLEEISAGIDLPVAGQLPWDPRSVDVLWGRRRPTSGWAQRGLPAAARSLARRLTARPATADSASLTDAARLSRRGHDRTQWR